MSGCYFLDQKILKTTSINNDFVHQNNLEIIEGLQNIVIELLFY